MTALLLSAILAQPAAPVTAQEAHLLLVRYRSAIVQTLEIKPPKPWPSPPKPGVPASREQLFAGFSDLYEISKPRAKFQIKTTAKMPSWKGWKEPAKSQAMRLAKLGLLNPSGPLFDLKVKTFTPVQVGTAMGEFMVGLSEITRQAFQKE